MGRLTTFFRSPSRARGPLALLAVCALALGCETIIGAHFDVSPRETKASSTSGAGGTGPGGSGGAGGNAGGDGAEVLWAHSFGGPGIFDYGGAVTMDDAGNVFVVGVFSGTSDLPCRPAGSFPNHMFVAKILPDGSCGWMKVPGGAQAQGLALDAAGNLVVLGAMGNYVDFGGGTLPFGGGEDIVVGRLSADDGTDLGSFRLGKVGANEYSEGLALGPDGSMYIVGHYQGTTNLGSTPATALAGSPTIDGFVAKLDASGNPLWARGFPSDGGEDGFHAVTVTSDGKGVIVAGNIRGTVDFDGTKAVSNGLDDVVIFRLRASDGVVQWVRSFGGKDVDQPWNVVTRGTQVIVTGWFSGAVEVGNSFELPSDGDAKDVFLLLLDDANGWTSWATRFGGDRDDGGFGLAVASNGDVILSGEFRETLTLGDKTLVAEGDQDMFIARLPANPHLWGEQTIWALQYGSSEFVPSPTEERARRVAVSASGHVAVTGTYGLTTYFGGVKLKSLGDSDAVVALIAPPSP